MKIKMNLKRAAVLMVLVIAVLPAFAQRRQTSEEDIKRRVELVADTLELSDQQEKEVLAVEMEFYKNMQKVRENFNPETSDREAIRDKMIAMRAEVSKKYEKILTKEQFAKYKKMEEERRSNRQRQGQGGGQGDGAERGRGRFGN